MKRNCKMGTRVSWDRAPPVDGVENSLRTPPSGTLAPSSNLALAHETMTEIVLRDGERVSQWLRERPRRAAEYSYSLKQLDVLRKPTLRPRSATRQLARELALKVTLRDNWPWMASERMAAEEAATTDGIGAPERKAGRPFSAASPRNNVREPAVGTRITAADMAERAPRDAWQASSRVMAAGEMGCEALDYRLIETLDLSKFVVLTNPTRSGLGRAVMEKKVKRVRPWALGYDTENGAQRVGAEQAASPALEAAAAPALEAATAPELEEAAAPVLEVAPRIETTAAERAALAAAAAGQRCRARRLAALVHQQRERSRLEREKTAEVEAHREAAVQREGQRAKRTAHRLAANKLAADRARAEHELATASAARSELLRGCPTELHVQATEQGRGSSVERMLPLEKEGGASLEELLEQVLCDARRLCDALRTCVRCAGATATGVAESVGEEGEEPVVSFSLAARWMACHRRQASWRAALGLPPVKAAPMYHGTRSAVVPAILSEGLRAPNGADIKFSTNLARRHATGTIFATLNFSRALLHADGPSATFLLLTLPSHGAKPIDHAQTTYVFADEVQLLPCFLPKDAQHASELAAAALNALAACGLEAGAGCGPRHGPRHELESKCRGTCDVACDVGPTAVEACGHA